MSLTRAIAASTRAWRASGVSGGGGAAGLAAHGPAALPAAALPAAALPAAALPAAALPAAALPRPLAGAGGGFDFPSHPATTSGAHSPKQPKRRKLMPGSLRREPVAQPVLAVATIAHAIVKPRRVALPELDHVRHQPISTPVRRPHRRAGADRLLDLAHHVLERAAAGDRLRLRRGDRADLRAARPNGEVRVALGRRDLLDRALDADLAV